MVAGTGPGLGQALCESLLGAGYRVGALARSRERLSRLQHTLGEENFLALPCDVTDADQVDSAIGRLEERFGPPTIYIHNPGGLLMAPFLETRPADFESLWQTLCLSAVHGTQRVIPGMLEAGGGVVLLVGATASVKAGGRFSAFGTAKFALRGLGQSLAREFGPKGIHVAHLVIDGVMWGPRAEHDFNMGRAQCLDPAAVAATCLHLISQDRSAWTQELDVRPDVETY